MCSGFVICCINCGQTVSSHTGKFPLPVMAVQLPVPVPSSVVCFWYCSKYTRFAWAGGTCPCFTWAGGTFFPDVLLCQFLVLVRNRFWLYILHQKQPHVPYCIRIFMLQLVGTCKGLLMSFSHRYMSISNYWS